MKINKEELRSFIPTDQYYLGHLGEPKNKKCLCPFHDDGKNPNLHLYEDGRFYCFSCGATGDVFEFHQKITSLSFTETLKELAKLYAPHLLSKNSNGNVHRKAIIASDVPGDDVMKAVENKPEVKRKKYAGYKLKGVYQYQCHETGLIVYRIRMDHPDPDKNRKWIMPFSKIDEKWEFKEPCFEKGKPLYIKQPNKDDKVIYVVEGETCVDALADIDLNAVTSGASSSADKANWKQLKGYKVIIWPDKDEAGSKYSVAATSKILDLGCEIQVIEIDKIGLSNGQDCIDWLKSNDVKDIENLPLKQVKPQHKEKPKDKWKEQKPLYRSLPESDPFPVDELGSILSEVVEVMSEIIQAPKAICANSVIASAALSIQRHIDIVVDGRVSPSSIFFISIGASGERKSAVDKEALKPHFKYQEELRTAYKESLKNYYREIEAHKKAKEEALRNSKGFDEKLKALEKLGDEPESPLSPFVISEEPTYEGLVKSLEQGQASQGLFSDEGGRFIGGHGMNSDNALKTAAGLSGLWDGKSISRMRAGDGSSLLVGRRLSLHLMVQPNIAQIMLSNPLLVDQGFLSRILCVFPKSTAGSRKYKPIDLTESQAMKAFRNKITENLNAPFRTGEEKNELLPNQVELSLDAKPIWQMFHDKVEEQLSENGSLSSIRGLGNKAPEHALRLAAVLEGFDVPKISNFSRISNGYIRNSIILTQHYLNEGLRLFNSSIADPKLIEASKLLDWLRLNNKTVITLVEIYQFGPNCVRDVSKARQLMAILIEHGYAFPSLEGAEFDKKNRKEAYEVRV
jgi:hypothetical protein